MTSANMMKTAQRIAKLDARIELLQEKKARELKKVPKKQMNEMMTILNNGAK